MSSHPLAANVGGRPRLPTAVLKESGALAHNAHRYADRKDELQVKDPLSPPPKHLSKEERAVWKELVDRTVPGVLKAGDEFIVELAACLIQERRDKKASFAKANQLVSVLAQLGLTPAGRSMVKDPNAGKQKPKSGFGALRQGARA